MSLAGGGGGCMGATLGEGNGGGNWLHGSWTIWGLSEGGLRRVRLKEKLLPAVLPVYPVFEDKNSNGLDENWIKQAIKIA